MKDGLLPIVTVAGAAAVALLWSLSAQDPYWRLFDSVDVPAFEPDQEPSVALANAPLEFGNADSGSMSPLNGPLPVTTGVFERPVIEPHSAADVSDTTMPAPMVALAPPAEPGSLAEPGIDLGVAYGPPRASTPARVNLGRDSAASDPNSSELVVAFAPTPLPAPMALRDRGDGTAAAAASAAALDPFVAPAPPAQPRIAASQSTEETLGLKRSQRIGVQRRLALAGFNPRGVDGVFGPRTREAITDFQTAWGFPATGYLDASLITDLNQRTEDAHRAWRHQVAAARSAAPEVAPAASERERANSGGNGRCARDAGGRIIERQSLACDITGFGEKFISLGRNTLNDEDGEAVEVNSGAGPDTNTSSADR